MSSDQPGGNVPAPSPALQMPVQPVAYSNPTQQSLQMLGGAPQIDASHLLMNPHTAAMVASVAAAAAAQQMAQQQHQQQQQQGQLPQPAMGISPHLAALFGITAQAPYPALVAPVVAAPPSSSTATPLISTMQHWKLQQLENHVRMLRDTNQAVPPSVAMLLADARRKEDKRTAKRVANRKSACTSRARKKALVEEMTRTNARLRRQALILALLPDLVVTITIDGEITFCSAQVERVLRHNLDDLIGSNLKDLLIPESRKSLTDLINELVAAELAAVSDDDNAGVAAAAAAGAPSVPQQGQEENRNDHANANGNGENASGQEQESSLSSNGPGGGGAAVVSDQSFPLSVVKVQSAQSATGENSDLSTSNGKTTPALPPAGSGPHSSNSSLGNEKAETPGKDKPNSSSDDSLSSSSDAKNLREANENLNRNVRWHNEKLMSQSKASKPESIHKDDVTGAAVTANNASARLSSLQHRPIETRRKLTSLENNSSGDSSEDLLAGVEDEEKKKARGKNGNGSLSDEPSDESGYRESNESAREGEETSSSASEMSCGNGRRHKPLAPACNICLIRDDLTTIWCEVTSSIRTRSLDDEAYDADLSAFVAGNVKDNKSSKAGSTEEIEDLKDSKSKGEVKELLLCLRPIRDGEQTVQEYLRFVPKKKEDNTMSSSHGTSDEGAAKGPVKKRKVQAQESTGSDSTPKVTQSDSSREQLARKKIKIDGEDERAKAVAESLMRMMTEK